MSRGMKVYAVCDHSGGLGIAGGLKPEDLRERQKEIEQVQRDSGQRDHV